MGSSLCCDDKKKWTEVLRIWSKRSWFCLVSVFSVVPQEELPACSAGASAQSRVQAEQDPLLHHHDRLQPQLLLCREGRLTQWTEGSATQEHNASQVRHTCTCQHVSLRCRCLYLWCTHLFLFVSLQLFRLFFFFSGLSATVHSVKSMKDKFWGWAAITGPCRWP